jgi:hypothetical protein
MERYQECRVESEKLMKLADHVLTMTYPLVQDPKILKVVLHNVYEAMFNTLGYLLNYERYYKRVPPFTENYPVMVEMAKDVFRKYNISTGYVGFLNEINETVETQKQSEVEFVRKEKVVFASKDYDLNAISVKELKEFIAKAKLFMQDINRVVKENERIDGKR